MSVFGENGPCCLSHYLKTHIFETSVIFLEPTTKLFTGKFDLQK